MTQPSDDPKPAASESSGATWASLAILILTLALKERDLLRAELSANARRLGFGAVLLVVGAAALVTAFALLPAAAILGLVAAGMRPFPAALAVLAGLVLIGLAALWAGRRATRLRRLAPVATFAQLSRDLQAVRAALDALHRRAPAKRPPDGDAKG